MYRDNVNIAISPVKNTENINSVINAINHGFFVIFFNVCLTSSFASILIKKCDVFEINKNKIKSKVVFIIMLFLDKKRVKGSITLTGSIYINRNIFFSFKVAYYCWNYWH